MLKPLSLADLAGAGVGGCERDVPYNDDVGDEEYGDAGTEEPVESDDAPLNASPLPQSLLTDFLSPSSEGRVEAVAGELWSAELDDERGNRGCD